MARPPPKRRASTQPKRNLYQEVTDKILAMLDAGTVPWRHPIRRTHNSDGLPRNLHSGKNYRGINVFLLSVTGWMRGYESDDWLTFRQAKSKGGSVRKGEKASLVVFWKQVETRDRETDEPITIPVLRHYNVFNTEQCEGIEPPDALPPDPGVKPFEPLAEAEAIIAGYSGGPKIEHAGGRAFYRPATDVIRLPAPERFESRESYYATLFHEAAHSTGHSSRLDRGLDTTLAPFGSPDYSKEELTAEMGAAFLCAVAGISPPTIEQSAAYINGWQKQLTDDAKLVIAAAGAGQKAADWIRGPVGPPCE